MITCLYYRLDLLLNELEIHLKEEEAKERPDRTAIVGQMSHGKMWIRKESVSGSFTEGSNLKIG